MTAAERERLRVAVDKARRARYRRAYGRLWHAIAERIERELEDRAQPSYLDRQAERRGA
jgi:hypothetical protein